MYMLRHLKFKQRGCENPRTLETSTVSTEDAGYISGKYLPIETA